MTEQSPLERIEIVGFCGNAMPYECIDEFFLVIGTGKKRKDKILKEEVPIGFSDYKEAQSLKQQIENDHYQAIVFRQINQALRNDKKTWSFNEASQYIESLIQKAKDLAEANKTVNELYKLNSEQQQKLKQIQEFQKQLEDEKEDQSISCSEIAEVLRKLLEEKK